MTHDDKGPEPKPQADDRAGASPGDGSGTSSGAPEASAQAEPRQAETAEAAQAQASELDTLKGQIADLTDRLLRAHAEMDNMRKRAEREREETSKYAISRFAREIVGVGDNLQRALAAVPPGAADTDPALKALIDGVAMTERELLNVLQRHGVKRLDPKGEMFNPHQHQAMMEMENAEVAPGTILEVYQPGYLIDDRVLRPAMVVVAKGGAKPVKDGPPPAAPQPAANDDTPVGNGNGERKAGAENR